MFQRLPSSALATLYLILTGVTGCANQDYSEAYKARLVRSLPFPFGVTFEDTQAFPGGVLCGRFTFSPDGSRLETGPFVVTPDRALSRPGEEDREVHCTSDPAEALYRRRGIGGPDADLSVLAAIRDDMRALDTAITAYYNARAMMPASLAALDESGFLSDAAILRDPWGAPYRFEPGLAGRTTPVFNLGTLGRDGAPGGTGPDADIEFAQLGLVEHVLRVEGY